MDSVNASRDTVNTSHDTVNTSRDTVSMSRDTVNTSRATANNDSSLGADLLDTSTHSLTEIPARSLKNITASLNIMQAVIESEATTKKCVNTSLTSADQLDDVTPLCKSISLSIKSRYLNFVMS